MAIQMPTFVVPFGVSAPPEFAHFIGYHGTSNAKAKAVLAGGNPSQLVGNGELGHGLYVTSNQQEAVLYAARQEGNDNAGAVLHVFCNENLGAASGVLCDAANFPNPAGMNCSPIIPPNLLALPFLQDANITAQIKINAALLGDVAFR